MCEMAVVRRHQVLLRSVEQPWGSWSGQLVGGVRIEYHGPLQVPEIGTQFKW